MCGIIGIVSKDINLKEQFKLNLNSIYHRGPDEGEYSDLNNLLSVGFRRLAIVDSSNKTMPFYDSKNNNYSIFNGEIYNYKNLIQSENIPYHGKSDGEVILPLYKKYGPEFFKLINGMFAIFIYDSAENSILLARDHFGQKPLYYFFDGKNFLFSSELRSFKNKYINFEIDNNSIYSYLRLGYIHSPNTIYKNIFKIEPGSFIKFNLNNFKISKFNFYNHFDYEVDDEIDYEDAKKTVREKLITSLERRFQGDFEVNFALSGGLDSSVLALISQQILGKKINTYTIENDFPYLSEQQNQKFNEDSAFASFLSNKYNIKNQKVKINSDDLLLSMNKTHDIIEEPNYSFQNLSLYNLYKSSSLTSKVMMTGDGSDELFGGYNFLYFDFLYGAYSNIPLAIRKKINSLSKIIPKLKESLFFEKGLDINSIQDRYLNWHNVFDNKTLNYIVNFDYDFKDTEERINNIYPYQTNKFDLKKELNDIEFSVWLRDHYCVYIDKISMANSIELRFPFMDQDLINFVQKLPFHFKSSKNNRKKLLKDSFSDILPIELYNRKKFGLLPPASMWLRNELKSDLYYSLETAFSDNNYFDYNKIKTLVDNHINMKKYNLPQIWSLYSLSKFLIRQQ